jgi:PEP-CTERM putative exosortase interaction domain
MTKLPNLLVAGLGLAAAPFAHAQTPVTITAFGATPSTGSADYVTANQNFQRTASKVGSDAITGDYRNSFNDSSSLHPLAGYSGPKFYGGYEIITNNSTGAGNSVIGTQRVSQSSNAAVPDSVQIVSPFVAWSNATSASLAGYFVFRQEDWLGTSPSATAGYNIGTLQANFSIASGNTSYNQGAVVRWVVQAADGQYYISEAGPVASQTVATTASQNVAETSWAAITPATSGGLNLDLGGLDYSVSGAAMSATGITSIGFYFENDLFTGNNVGSPSQYNFQVFALGFTGVAASTIPEPSAAALLGGVAGLALVAARRRRHGTHV